VPPIGTRGRDGERQHSCRPAGWRREPVAEGGATLARHDGGGGRKFRRFSGRLDKGLEDLHCLLTLWVWKEDGGSSGCPLPGRRV
jgi:hypothetical protein